MDFCFMQFSDWMYIDNYWYCLAFKAEILLYVLMVDGVEEHVDDIQ